MLENPNINFYKSLNNSANCNNFVYNLISIKTKQNLPCSIYQKNKISFTY